MNKKGKINIIDLGVLLIILLFIAGLGIRLVSTVSKKANEANNLKTYQYTVAVEGVRDFTVDALKKLGSVTDGKGDKVIGEIVSVEEVPYEVETINNRGEAIVTSVPTKNKCIVTFNADGMEVNDRYYTTNDIEMSVGRGFSIITKYVSTTGMITSIKELD